MKTTIQYESMDSEVNVILENDKYQAIIAPWLGSNVLRIQDKELGIEILRYNADNTVQNLRTGYNSFLYGLPTLYLPNRLSGGNLKVSDSTYHFPINEPELNNHLHGFLHTRSYTVTSTFVNDTDAIVTTEYIFDEKDPAYEYFPVSFKAAFKFTLNTHGFFYEFTMTNLSTKMLPFGVGNHTTINAPFTKDGDPHDVRLTIPAVQKVVMNDKFIPTGVFESLNDYDLQYPAGIMKPVTHEIDNDMYSATYTRKQGFPFYGCIVTDIKKNHGICYKVDEAFRYWLIWNDWDRNGYFCPEPMSWIIDAPNLNMSQVSSGYLELGPGESKTVHEHIYTFTK